MPRYELGDTDGEKNTQYFCALVCLGEWVEDTRNWEAYRRDQAKKLKAKMGDVNLFPRADTEDHSTIWCPCGAMFRWGDCGETLMPWLDEHVAHVRIDQAREHALAEESEEIAAQVKESEEE